VLSRGDTIAGYRIERVLGSGGMGVVYEATQLSLDRTVALKVLAPQLRGDGAFKRRFQREAQVQARLDHPHIVAVHEAGETEQGLFIAMRLIRGANLKDLIVARELDVGRALRILAQVADAIDAAHDAGLVHRDVKPHNILVAGRDHAYLADFGLTYAADATSLTETGQFVGTIDYIAPEQISSDTTTAASDVYSFAAVLFEALAGVVPYPKESKAAVLYAHLAAPPPRVSEHRPELPRALDAVIARAMAKEPSHRHARATDVVREAEEAFTREVRAALAPPGPIERPSETGVRVEEGRISTVEGEQPSFVDDAATHAPRSPDSGSSTRAYSHASGGDPEPRESSAPTRADARPPDPGARPRGRMLVTAAALVAFAASAAGAALVTGDSVDPAPVSSSAVRAGALELRLTDAWTATDAVPAVPGLGLRDALEVAPRRLDGRAGVAVATTRATGAALLPAEFAERVGASALEERRRPVRAGGLAGYRYANLDVDGFARRVTVYVFPTSRGVATVACSADPPVAAAFARDCDSAAAALTLREGEAYPLGPAPALARALDRVLPSLARDRTALRGRLARARTPGGQVDVLGRLSAVHARAARAIGAPASPPQASPAVERLLGALRAARDAYAGMARAARRGERGRFRAGASDVRRADAAADRALAALARLGY
jgi:serine/threonine protein kinase